MWPTVQVNNLNQLQGPVAEVERHLLFIGSGATNTSKLLSVNTQSDFDTLLGPADSVLKANVIAARDNAGQNWTAAVHVLAADESWTDAALKAQAVGSYEGIVNLQPVTTKAEITAAQALRAQLISKFGRWQWILLTVGGIDTANESWSEYDADLTTLVNGVAANGVMVVPQLHGTNAGILAGRLCDRSVTIADSPMRVKTGPLIGIGDHPLDADGIVLPLATLQTLHAARLSVPCWFPDYEGIYWADGNMLEVDGGDYQVIEYVRVTDKAARRMRKRGIARIADRALNSTPGSVAAAITYFGKDLREMSRSATIAGIQFPGEIMPPTDGDIVIEWKNKNEVAIYAQVQPYDCPKKIAINILLDLSLSSEE
jgi:hypothetical protein